MSHLAGIFGCSGPRLTADERAFFAEVRPWAFILFARNIQTADQTRALIDALRASVDDPAALVFVDQEGGRVQRLKPPLARLRRPAQAFGALYARDPEGAAEAVTLNHQLIAHELMSLGFDADCAPCLDLRLPETHDVIGDRSFGSNTAEVSMLGRAALDGLMAGGVAPVIKHIPGHGRARVDSHLDLPVVATPLAVLEATDFAPFRALSDAPMAMTAHVTFTDVDPDNCVTLSHRAIGVVIRGSIGFDGLLMSDDLSMKALGGGFEERARRALDAGCDVILPCNGDMAEMTAVAEGTGLLTGRAAERAADARATARRVQPFDVEAAEAHLANLGLGAAP
ncbi:MAG TPA: beta-N-acetylhexosaminidase [Caulobacteraceae bacterium]|nr:beta-N-acetylhexosaminidase [Caulobacteraceae bacterium]